MVTITCPWDPPGPAPAVLRHPCPPPHSHVASPPPVSATSRRRHATRRPPQPRAPSAFLPWAEGRWLSARPGQKNTLLLTVTLPCAGTLLPASPIRTGSDGVTAALMEAAWVWGERRGGDSSRTRSPGSGKHSQHTRKALLGHHRGVRRPGVRCARNWSPRMRGSRRQQTPNELAEIFQNWTKRVGA